MPVFQAYLKIIRHNATQLLIYLGIVVALAIMMNQFNAQRPLDSFTETKVPMAFINEDIAATGDGAATVATTTGDGAATDATTTGDGAATVGAALAADAGTGRQAIAVSSALGSTTIVSGLRDFLGQHANIVEVANDPDKIRDALYFGKIYYVIRIPAGFAESFNQNGPARLEQLSAPDSTATAYMTMLVNQYLNTARLFRLGLPDTSDAEIARLTRETLAISTPVTMKAVESRQGSYNNLVYFYNYLAYALLAILILGITTCMLTFSELDLRRRNLVSPVTLKSLNLQMIAGALLFSVASWAVMVAVSLALYGAAMLTASGAYLALNSFVFMLVGLSLSYLAGNLLTSRNAQAAVANVLTLGMSFISGVFVPQAILGKTVLAIARFTPTFWFVKANITIGAQPDLAGPARQDILLAILVQLAFAAGFLAVAWIVVARKRQRAS